MRQLATFEITRLQEASLVLSALQESLQASNKDTLDERTVLAVDELAINTAKISIDFILKTYTKR